MYLSTNARFETAFTDFLADSSFEKPQLSVEETTAEDEKFGVVGALAQLVDREFLGDDDLLVVAGDNLISFELAEFVDFFEQQNAPTLAAYDVGLPHRAREYGVLEVENTRVTNFQEKPDDPSSSLVSIACYAFPASDIRFAEYLEEGNNPDEPGWFIQWLQDRRPVHAFTFDEAWFDIGTPESYLDAVSWALEDGPKVADSATVERSSLGESVHVLPDATVLDSTLERTVVFPSATVENVSLRSSIVDREAIVRNMDLSGALVSAHSVL